MRQETNGRLRPNEDFVIRCLTAFFSGESWPGENPPDAYLRMGEHVAAVEISTLSQRVRNRVGRSMPRLSDDATARWLANQLDRELHGRLPRRTCVILTLSSPVFKARKVKAKLKDKIIAHVSAGNEAVITESILGSRVTIRLVAHDRPSGKKIVAIVRNRRSFGHIISNARDALVDRLVVKTEKCRSLEFEGPLWLALFNDYWLADTETYQQALDSSSCTHSFKKILLVDSDGRVVELYEKRVEASKSQNA